MHLRPAVVCPLSLLIQQDGAQVQRLHGQQVDVHLGRRVRGARVIGPPGRVALGLTHHHHVDGGGLRGVLRHLRQLPALYRGPGRAAPHGGQRLQLCAAHRLRHGERAHGSGCLHVAAGRGRHPGVLGRLARGQEQVEARPAGPREAMTRLCPGEGTPWRSRWVPRLEASV